MKNPLNPYDFVPFAETVSRKNMDEWQSAPLYTGYIKCNLHAVSPLCINSIFTDVSKEVFIPGTSIKGMLRQLISVLSSGCGEFIERDYAYLRDKLHHRKIVNYAIEYFVTHGQFPDGNYDKSQYRSCAQCSQSETGAQIQLCRTCYLFGFVGDTGALAGRIRVTDTDRHSVELSPLEVLRLDIPRCYSWSFYFENSVIEAQERHYPEKPVNTYVEKYPDALPPAHRGAHANFGVPKSHKIVHLQGGKYRGRKFYRHTHSGCLENYKNLKGEKTLETPVQKLFVLKPEPSHKFAFQVHFEEISRDDLGLLIFALTLQKKLPPSYPLKDDIRHKIGYGKPLGFGSVDISANKLMLIRSNAYLDFSEPALEDATSDLFKIRNEFITESQIFQSKPYQKIADIWKWPGQPIAYPDLKSFFGNKNNRIVDLENYNAGNWPPKENKSSESIDKVPVPKSKKTKKIARKVRNKPITTDLQIDAKTKIGFVTIDGVRLDLKDLYLSEYHATKVKLKVDYNEEGYPVKATFKGWVA